MKIVSESGEVFYRLKDLSSEFSFAAFSYDEECIAFSGLARSHIRFKCGESANALKQKEHPFPVRKYCGIYNNMFAQITGSNILELFSDGGANWLFVKGTEILDQLAISGGVLPLYYPKARMLAVLSNYNLLELWVQDEEQELFSFYQSISLSSSVQAIEKHEAFIVADCGADGNRSIIIVDLEGKQVYRSDESFSFFKLFEKGYVLTWQKTVSESAIHLRRIDTAANDTILFTPVSVTEIAQNLELADAILMPDNSCILCAVDNHASTHILHHSAVGELHLIAILPGVSDQISLFVSVPQIFLMRSASGVFCFGKENHTWRLKKEMRSFWGPSTLLNVSRTGRRICIPIHTTMKIVEVWSLFQSNTVVWSAYWHPLIRMRNEHFHDKMKLVLLCLLQIRRYIPYEMVEIIVQKMWDIETTVNAKECATTIVQTSTQNRGSRSCTMWQLFFSFSYSLRS